MRPGPLIAVPVLLLLVLASVPGPVAHAAPAHLPAASSVRAHAPLRIAAGPGVPGHAAGSGRSGPLHAVANGVSAVPHPGPIPASRVASYSGHYYAGSVYNGTPVNSTRLSMTLNVPADNPQSFDFYYVLLSVWDDAGSYDQIGFSNDFGTWGFTYSTTDYCANNYYYNPNAFSLNEATTYTFTMTLYKGVVNFTADYLNGTNAYTWTQQTGGHVFLNDAFYTCNGGFGNTSYYDLTDYEEVYQTQDNLVPYNWHFGGNTENQTPLVGWGNFTTPPLPGTISILITGDNTTVANEPFELALAVGVPWVTIVTGNVSVSIAYSLEVSAVVGSPKVTLGGYLLPGGWSVSFSPTTSTAPFSTSGTLKVPAGTGSGNYSVGLNATDATGAAAQITVWVNVLSSASLVVLASPHPFGDVGQNVTLVLTGGAGISGVTLSWSGLPVGCSTPAGGRVACTLTTPGTYPIVVTAHDAYGDVAASTPLEYIVYTDPLIVVTVLPPEVDAGQSVNWFASATGGTGGSYSYRYAGLPGSCTIRGPNATCTVPTPGTYNVTVWVTDASGYAAPSSPAAVVVVLAPTVTIARATFSADVGQTVWLNATGAGGSGRFTYLWTDLPPSCTSSGASARCDFSMAGGYYVSVEAQDSGGVLSAPYRAYVDVSPAVTVHLTTPLPSADLGQTTTFSTNVGGGLAPYHYVYNGLPTGCLGTDTGSLACAPTAVGAPENVTVVVTDANGFVASASTVFTVFSAPGLSLAVAPASVVVGGSVTFTATVAGGAGGTTFVWSELPGGCAGSVGGTITCAPTGTGTFLVSVVATDADGVHTNASAVLSVHSAPAVPASELLGLGLIVGVAVALVVVALLLRRRRRAASAGGAPTQ